MLVWSGNVASVFGDCFNGVAIGLWMLQTTGSARYMAAVLMVHLIVNLLLGAVAGTIADRVDRRKLMIAADLWRAGVVAVLASCLHFSIHNVWLVLGLVLLSALASVFQAPAFQASIGQLAGNDNVRQATGLVHLGDNSARIAGLALAGVVVAAYGGSAAVTLNASAYLLSAICVIAAGPFPAVPRLQREPSSFRRDLAGGLAYIRKDDLTRSVVILNPLLVLFFMSSLMLVQVTAVQAWHAGPVAFGLIEMCVPLGYILGAGAILRFGSRIGRRGRWISVGLVLMGPAFLLISLMNSAAAALPFILLGGMLFALCTMLIQIILRTEIPAEMQGRVYGTLGAVTGSAPALGLAVFSWLADRWGAQNVLTVQSAALLAIGVLAVVYFKPIRSYK